MDVERGQARLKVKQSHRANETFGITTETDTLLTPTNDLAYIKSKAPPNMLNVRTSL